MGERSRLSSGDGTKEAAKGQISLDIWFRPDDQIHYSIGKEGRVIKGMQVSIERGGSAGWAVR
jgi:hypothetical protein